jgi:hypothetical protein
MPGNAQEGPSFTQAESWFNQGEASALKPFSNIIHYLIIYLFLYINIYALHTISLEYKIKNN